MTSPSTRALDLLAPTPSPTPASPGPDDARLRDEQVQLARLDLSLARAEREGATSLAGRLTLLRHAQQGRVMEARRAISDLASGDAVMEALARHPAIVAAGLAETEKGQAV